MEPDVAPAGAHQFFLPRIAPRRARRGLKDDARQPTGFRAIPPRRLTLVARWPGLCYFAPLGLRGRLGDDRRWTV